MDHPHSQGIPALLSLNAGYIDTTSFLALHGLFAAHVTGNFVTLAASLVTGTSGAVGKLLALPLFCGVIIATRVASDVLRRLNLPVLRSLLLIKFLLLATAFVLAAQFAPFTNGDAPAALATGMVMVAAMAIQNAAHRVHFAHAPPSTLMTGTTTQIMIDLADLLYRAPPEAKLAARERLPRMGLSVLMFAVGCATAAILFRAGPIWCFAIPPSLALFILIDHALAEPGTAPAS